MLLQSPPSSLLSPVASPPKYVSFRKMQIFSELRTPHTSLFFLYSTSSPSPHPFHPFLCSSIESLLFRWHNELTQPHYLTHHINKILLLGNPARFLLCSLLSPTILVKSFKARTFCNGNILYSLSYISPISCCCDLCTVPLRI